MIPDVLFWLYFANAILIITHEIDSGYWREWELFGMRGGIDLFLLLHIPMLGAILYGLIEAHRGTMTGAVFSLILGGAGIFAFCIHTYFIKKGRPEFRGMMSQAILHATLVISLLQTCLTLYRLLA
ncbi:MAG TPA: hypothetical protein PLE73_05915 [Spirochaetota bacterium]|nr:hypothetical protein [Spirochaetota bacterium]HPI22713.1 hypothetical protein [Spirochaetota bacterium]HPU87549.1 hypothetical protein [Spirochaetota bacterium]